MLKKILTILLMTVLSNVLAYSQTEVVKMYLVSAKGMGAEIGTITLKDTEYGLLITPNLKGLTPGVHGLHIHQNPSCMPAKKGTKLVPALKAGGHYDPQKTNAHLGPYNKNGHLGDLPALSVTQNGRATLAVLAPRLTLSMLSEHALMIHQGADNYSDQPQALGGGGGRVACGIIKNNN
ncbi:superoxide dismutase family protein [Thiotrichales bacterium 19S3-7]|nr:superoxide dismutase family protein [Thiotrichales bacterium 19S3-7]MCF6802023.1 superoxide dismutase family protein [Thiotrichales bacterium 19S3-11]